jgi:tail assembly protein
MTNRNNVFTLDALEDELNTKYAPLVFEIGGESFTLLSLLRTSKARRAKVLEAMKEFGGEGDGTVTIDTEADDFNEDEMIAALKVVLSNVVEGPDSRGKKLVSLIGDDLLKLMIVMEHWSEATQPGEAKPSSN